MLQLVGFVALVHGLDGGGFNPVETNPDGGVQFKEEVLPYLKATHEYETSETNPGSPQSKKLVSVLRQGWHIIRHCDGGFLSACGDADCGDSEGLGLFLDPRPLVTQNHVWYLRSPDYRARGQNGCVEYWKDNQMLLQGEQMSCVAPHDDDPEKAAKLADEGVCDYPKVHGFMSHCSSTNMFCMGVKDRKQEGQAIGTFMKKIPQSGSFPAANVTSITFKAIDGYVPSNNMCMQSERKVKIIADGYHLAPCQANSNCVRGVRGKSVTWVTDPERAEDNCWEIMPQAYKSEALFEEKAPDNKDTLLGFAETAIETVIETSGIEKWGNILADTDGGDFATMVATTGLLALFTF